MDRKQFLKTCGLGCLGGIAAAGVLQSCATGRQATGTIEGDNLVVPLESFGNEAAGYRRFVVLHNDLLKFPICVFRHAPNDFFALWMECTHMGAELQLFGDVLQCPAHGSEFNNKGGVRSGPADRQLRSFPILIADNHIKISLKK